MSTNITTQIITEEEEEQNECLDEFVNLINQRITISCCLPGSIPTSEIKRITNQAKEWFYKNYEDAIEERYLALPWSELKKQTFQEGIKTTLSSKRGQYSVPDSVISVVGVYEMDGYSGEGGHFGGLSRGYEEADGNILKRALTNSVYNNNVAVAADNLTYYVVIDSFLDTTRQLFQDMIGFKYNRNTKKIVFLGDLPKSDVILDVLVAIDDCALFQDNYFFEYVVDKVKIELAEILTRYQYSLPGNVALNTGLVEDAKSDLQELVEEIKGMSSPSYIITT